MPKIELRKAYFRGFSFTAGPARGEGAPIVKAQFAAPWTEKHREAGSWEEIPETVSGSIKLKPAQIAGTHLEFIPGGGMDKHRISLDINSVDDCVVFVPTREDEERELRFNVRTSVNNAEAMFGRLGRTVGNAGGVLKLSYDAEAQQRLIDGEPATDDAQQTLAEGA